MVTITVDEPGPIDRVTVTGTPDSPVGRAGSGSSLVMPVGAKPGRVTDPVETEPVGGIRVETTTVNELGPREIVAVTTTPGVGTTTMPEVLAAEPPGTVGEGPTAESIGVVIVVMKTVDEPGPNGRVVVTTVSNSELLGAEPPGMVGPEPTADSTGVVIVVTKTVDESGPNDRVAVTTASDSVAGVVVPPIVGVKPVAASAGVVTVVTMTVEEPGPSETVAVMTTPGVPAEGGDGPAEPPGTVGDDPVPASVDEEVEPLPMVGVNPVAASVGVVTVVTNTVEDPGPRETVAVTTTPGVSGE